MTPPPATTLPPANTTAPAPTTELAAPPTGPHTLTPAELETLVRTLARRADRWRPLVRHDPRSRVSTRLDVGPGIDAWVISWTGPDHDTGFHDHDVSNAAVAVVEGAIVEDVPVVTGSIGRTLQAGEVVSFDATHVHRMRHPGAGAAPAVTIHVYSPPLRSRGAYRIVNGVVRRAPQSADEELVPG